MKPDRHSPEATPRASRGVTLIELMIAMVLGILVTGGIITVFLSTAKSSRAQEQQARLQEAGRFAIGQLTQSLRMANASYCSGSGGAAIASTAAGSVFVDGLRAPTILASSLTLHDNTTEFGDSNYPAAPTTTYTLPSYLYMRGYDCGKVKCDPMDPHDDVTAIPEMGTTAGDRVVGADVLTVRYFDADSGWKAGDDPAEVFDMRVDGRHLQAITMVRSADEPAFPSSIDNPYLIMLSDCSDGQVFSADIASSSSTATFTVNPVDSGNFAYPVTTSAPQQLAAAKVFIFDRAFTTVTWYLEVVDNGSAAGSTTGALMRRVNGEATELARGVERMDFRYAVEDMLGMTRYLTANQVDMGITDVNCPQQPPLMPGLSSTTGLPAESASVKGCLWRGIKTIEISLLLDGQQPLSSLADKVLAYAYSPDGSSTPQPPGHVSHDVSFSDQGFAEHMIRREFSTLVSIRNYNP